MNRSFVMLFITCCVALLCSCNSTKQLERKQQEAVDMVKGSRQLIDKICITCFDLYKPPAVDTNWHLLLDTPGMMVPVIDSAATKKAIDSLKDSFVLSQQGKHERNDCNNEIDASYKKGFNDAVKQVKQQKLPPSVDSGKLIKLLHDYQALQSANNFLTQQNEDVSKRLDTANKRNDTYQSSEKEVGYSAMLLLKSLVRSVWFWLIVVILVVIKFRNPIISFIKERTT